MPGMDFAKKVINTAGATFLVRIFGLIGSVLLGRFLGPKGLGVFTILRAVPTFLVALISIGLPTAAIYYVSREPQRRPDIASSLLCYSVSIGTIFAVGLWVASPFLNKIYFDANLKTIYFFLLSFLVPLMLFIRLGSAILQGLYRIVERNGVEVLIRSSLIIGYLAFVWIASWRIFGALVSLVIAHFAACVYILIFIRRDIRLTLSRNFAALRQMIGYALSAYVGQFLEQIEGNVVFLILGTFVDTAGLGLFAVAMALSGFVLFPSTAIARPMLPRLARMDSKEAAQAFVQILQIGLLMSLFTAVAIFCVAPYAVPFLYGSKFEGVIKILSVLLPGFICAAVLSFIRVYFLSIGKPLWRLYLSIFRAALLLTGILIGGVSGGIMGSAIGLTIAFLLTLLAGLLFVFCQSPVIDFRDLFIVWSPTLAYVKAFISMRKNNING